MPKRAIDKAVGRRVRQARESMSPRVPQNELAKRVGMKDPSTLSKLERGETDRSTFLPALARETGTRVDWMQHGTGPMQPGAQADVNARVGTHSSSCDDAMLYQFADSRCVHGPNAGRGESYHLATIAVSRRTLESLDDLDETEAIGHVHRDGSMGTTIKESHEVVIDTRQRSPSVHNGDVFAIDTGGALMLRTIVYHPGGRITVACEAPDKTRYPDTEFEAEAARAILDSVVGRARWSGGEL